MEDTTQLLERIAEIKQHLDQLREQGIILNEATTEYTVIDPLMSALGYGPATLHKQDKDKETRLIPDYTLLRGDRQWFLEVKRLDAQLTDAEAMQAVGYAVNKGAAWAVLTNGRSWRIYRAHLPKPLPEKRVFCVDNIFEQPEAVDILNLLSRASMEQDGLSRAWKIDQINNAVQSELVTDGSQTRRTMVDIVSERIGEKATEAEIVIALRDLLRLPVNPVQIAIDSTNESSTSTANQPELADGAPPGNWHTLENLVGNFALVTGKKPSRLYIIGGEASRVNHWNAVIGPMINFLATNYSLPNLPYRTGSKGKRCFLNQEPKHTDGKDMTVPIKVNTSQGDIYVEAHWSASDLLRLLLTLQNAMQALPRQINIEITS